MTAGFGCVRLRIGPERIGVVSVRTAADLLGNRNWPGPRNEQYAFAARVVSDALVGHCKPHVAAKAFARAARNAGVLDADEIRPRQKPPSRPRQIGRVNDSFGPPVRVTFRPGASLEIHSVADVAACLLKHWRHDCRDEAYLAALEACLSVRAGMAGPALTRRAFARAAARAGAVCER
jgi:hypothetical protein